jgi:Domain of unknown function (DUF4126)
MDTLLQLWQSMAGMAHKSTQAMDMAQLMALAAALGWASGIRLYAVVFITGMAGWMGWLPLPAGLSMLQHPAVLAGSGFMLFVEFFADKIPGLDSLWDLVHSVIRVPAGAALAAGVFGADSATMGMAAGLLGGTLAATSFATKATTRAAINTSPEPFSNIAVSLLEDGLVLGMMWLATNYPVTFGVVLFVVLVLSIWLLIVLIKFLKSLFQRIKGWMGGEGVSLPG